MPNNKTSGGEQQIADRYGENGNQYQDRQPLDIQLRFILVRIFSNNTQLRAFVAWPRR